MEAHVAHTCTERVLRLLLCPCPHPALLGVTPLYPQARLCPQGARRYRRGNTQHPWAETQAQPSSPAWGLTAWGRGQLARSPQGRDGSCPGWWPPSPTRSGEELGRDYRPLGWGQKSLPGDYVRGGRGQEGAQHCCLLSHLKRCVQRKNVPEGEGPVHGGEWQPTLCARWPAARP